MKALLFIFVCLMVSSCIKETVKPYINGNPRPTHNIDTLK